MHGEIPSWAVAQVLETTYLISYSARMYSYLRYHRRTLLVIQHGRSATYNSFQPYRFAARTRGDRPAQTCGRPSISLFSLHEQVRRQNERAGRTLDL